jgi:hypothetical protein
MSTTKHLQQKLDFYKNSYDCKKHSRTRIQTNNRYKYFTQTHFTAGDTQQFQEYSYFDYVDLKKDITNTDNIWKNIQLDICTKFRDLTEKCIYNTFTYLYNKFKKGIYIRIQDNKLAVFLPFSKANYINEFGNRTKIDTKFQTFQKVVQTSQKFENRKYDPKRVNSDPKTWYGNNCLIRYEYPLSEGDSGAVQMKNMFDELCKNRELPDMSFFVNRRDFPVLHRQNYEAYSGVFGEKHNLVSHQYEKYAPILSMNSRNDFCDIPIPTWEDWDRVRSISDGVFFPKACRDYRFKFDTKWENKKNVAVFRGASTGCGIDINSNMRLKVSYISQEVVPTVNGKKILNAGITSWNARPRFHDGKLTTLNKDSLQLVNKLSPEEQSRYKYIINIDGHSSAYRLSLELSMGSVILLVDSDYFLWYRKKMTEYVHYVPVKRDLSDLVEKIEWCLNHDKECQEIAHNALQFYQKYLNKSSIYDYLQNTLIKLKKNGGDFVPHYYTDRLRRKKQTDDQKTILKSIFSNFLQTKSQQDLKINTNFVQKSVELKDLLHGIQMMLQNQIVQKKKTGLHNPQKVVSTSRVNIVSYSFLNKQNLLVMKIPKNSINISEFMHEIFMGIVCINKVRIEIPNFAYTFGTFKGKLTIENIPGKNFQDWLEHNFQFDEYIRILYQLCLSLETARNKCNFYHNDLYPWNVMLKQDNRMKVDYNISIDSSITIQNIKVIPVVIDYGKSSGKYLNTEYFLNSSSCNIQDIISILLSSLHIIINKTQISPQQFNKVKLLSKFFDQKYIAKYIMNGEIVTFGDLRKFTDRAKKYDEVMFGNKPGMENKQLLHFREYLQTFFSDELKPLNIKYNDSIAYIVEYNYKQVFEYISATGNQGRYDSYRNILYGFKTCTLPQEKNRFLQCMISMTFKHNLFKMYNNYKTFQNFGYNRNKKMEELYNNCMYWIRNIYLENKGLEIGFKHCTENIRDTIQISNVLFSRDSFMYRDPFYLEQFKLYLK